MLLLPLLIITASVLPTPQPARIAAQPQVTVVATARIISGATLNLASGTLRANADGARVIAAKRLIEFQ